MAIGYLHTRDEPQAWEPSPPERWSVLFVHGSLIGDSAAYTVTCDIPHDHIRERIECMDEMSKPETTDLHLQYGPFKSGITSAYRVEKIDSNACRDCGHGTYWDIVGPDDVALGRSFGDPIEAQWMARMMSIAYEEGQGAGAGQKNCEAP